MKKLVSKIRAALVLILSVLLLGIPVFTQSVYADEMSEQGVYVLPSNSTMTNIQTFIEPPSGDYEANSASTSGTNEYLLAGMSVGDGGFIRTNDTTTYNLVKNNLEVVYTIRTTAFAGADTSNDYGSAFILYYRDPSVTPAWSVTADADFERLGLYGVSGESGTHIPNALAVEFDNLKRYDNSTVKESNLDSAATTILNKNSHIAITRPITTTDAVKLEHWAASNLTTPYANGATNAVRITWKLIDQGATAAVEDNTYQFSYYYYQGKTDASGTATVSGSHSFSYAEVKSYFVEPTKVSIAMTGSSGLLAGKTQYVKFVSTYSYTVNYCIADVNGVALTRGTQTCVPVPGLSVKTGTAPAGPSDVGPFPAAPAGFTIVANQPRERTITTTAASNVYNVLYTDSQAPAITTITDRSVPEDQAITAITVSASDNVSSWSAMKVAVTGLPTGLSYTGSTSNGSISGTPSQPGVYTVTVTATDEAGNVGSSQFKLTVEDKTPPVLSSVTTQTVPEDLPISTILLSATDNYDPAPVISASGLPEGLSYSKTAGGIVGTPSTPGTYPVTVTATDVAGNFSTVKFDLIVQDKTGPVIDAVTAKVYPADSAITQFTVTATDAYSPPATIVITGLPTGLTAAGGTVSGTPGELGDFQVLVTATDNVGNKTTSNFQITVEDKTGPVIVSIPDKTLPEDQLIDSIGVSVTDNYDPAPTITITGLPDGLSYNKTTGAIEGTPATPGAYTVTVTATDAANNPSTITFKITVLDKTGPVFGSITAKTFPADQAITDFTITATDPYSPPASISITGLPSGLSASAGTVSGTPIQVGDFTIQVTATDAVGNTSSTSFSLTIEDKTPPSITPIGDKLYKMGAQITAIAVSAMDTYSLPVSVQVNDLPVGLSFSNGEITGTPTVEGSYPVTVLATDAAGNPNSFIFTIVVDGTAPAVPVITLPHVGDTSVSGTAEPNSKVILNLPGGTTITVDVDANGNWTSGTIPALKDGDLIKAQGQDLAGNLSAETSAIVDGVAPSAPTIAPVKAGASTVGGTAEANALITVTWPGGSKTTTTADENGAWTIAAPVALTDGQTISATATDASGNASQPGTAIVDGTAPAAPVIAPVKAGAGTVSGTAEANALITVTWPTGGDTITTADENGVWTIAAPVTLEDGQTISATATDAAGNTSQPGSTIVDGQAPAIPVITLPIVGDTTISGTGEPNTQVILTPPGGSPVTVDVDANGNWSYGPIPALKDGDVIKAQGKDAAGNTSDPATAIVDGIAPSVPVITLPLVGDTTISGTGEANTQVILTLPNGNPVTVDVDGSGNWSYGPVTALKDGDVIKAQGKDASGNLSAETSVIVDGTAPSVPVITLPIVGDTTISGTGEPNTQVIITLPGGSTVTVDVDGSGNWSYGPIPALKDGDVIKAQGKDASGNLSAETSVTVDGTAPAAPVIAPVKAGASTVSGTAEANAVITVTWPVGGDTTTTADENGVWTIAAPVTLEDGQTISATATDASGNLSLPGTAIVDGSAPAAPVIAPVKAGASTVGGTAEANALITVTWPGGSKTTTTADEKGNWTIAAPVALTDGQTISATATDAAGNTSQPGSTVVDGTAPAAPMIDPVKAGAEKVSGTAEANALITVTWPDGTQTTTRANELGNWSIVPPVSLQNGQTISATATDAAGNESQPATATVDGVAPSAPVIAPVKAGANTVGGTAEPNAKLTVTWPGGGVTSTTADEKGNWTITPPVTLEDGQIISATATDAAGNESQPGTALVDGTAPSAPHVDPVEPGDTSIGGTGEPGATVIITWPPGSEPATSEVTVDENGNWSLDIPGGVLPLDQNDEIIVSQTDPAGNTGPATNVVVDDITPPGAPVIAPVKPAASQVTGTGEPGATVTVTFPGTPAPTVKAIVDNNGNWSVDVPQGLILVNGDKVFAQQSDTAGNPSPSTEAVVDGEAPVIELPIADSTHTFPEDSAITPIQVLATEQITIVKSIVVDGLPANLSYSMATGLIEGIPLDPGTYKVSITAYDLNDNASSITITIIVTDITPPVFIEPLSRNYVFDEDSPIAPAIQISAADNSGNAPLIEVLDLPANLQFDPLTGQITGTPLNPGIYTVTVRATDAANHVTQITLEITVNDLKPPAPQVVRPVAGSSEVSGHGVPGNKVRITLPNGAQYETVVDAYGNWIIMGLPSLNSGNEIKAIQLDSDLDESPEITVIVEAKANGGLFLPMICR